MSIEPGFKSFFSALTADEKRDLARRAQTSVAYLSQMANGYRSAGYSVSARLKAADSRITDTMLRPDIFGEAQPPARVA